MKKIALVSTDWNDNPYRKENNKYGGVTYYRLVKPMEQLKGKYDVTFFGAEIQKRTEDKSVDEFYDELTKEFDMVIVKQIDNATAAQALIHWCGVNKCILVQDFDDNMLVIREDQPATKMGYGVGGQRRAYAGSMMSLTDSLIVSTKPLKDYFQKFIKDTFNEDKDIYIYPNYNDVNDWNYKHPIKDPHKVVIGWAGSITHDADLLMIMPALGKVADKYDNVHVELLGGIMQGNIAYLTQSWTKKAKDKLKILFGVPAWNLYPELMMSLKWDIGLAPLIDDEFNRGKSHIKWMEYTMCGIPTIASDVYPYTKNVKHALLAKPDEWEEKMSFLVENKKERENLAKDSYEYIKKKLQWDQNLQYVEIVDDIFKKKYTR